MEVGDRWKPSPIAFRTDSLQVQSLKKVLHRSWLGDARSAACSAGVKNSRAMDSKSQFGSMRSTSMPTSRPQVTATSASLSEWDKLKRSDGRVGLTNRGLPLGVQLNSSCPGGSST